MPSCSCSSSLRRKTKTSFDESASDRTLLEDEARADEILLAQIGSLVVRELDLKKGRREARAVVGSVEEEGGGAAVEVAADANVLLVVCDGLDDVLSNIVLDGAEHAAGVLV